MPYKIKSGQYNQPTWFLTDEEVAFLKANKALENKKLFKAFNDHFACSMTYSRMRHFIAQYNLKKQDRGEKYTDAEKEFVLLHLETMSDIHIGKALGRTKHSIQKLRLILKLKRSPEAEKRLRDFRSKSGAKTLHARIAKGELQHPAVALHDSFVRGQMTKYTTLTEIPKELIQLKKVEFLLKRELKNGLDRRKNSISQSEL